MIQKQQPYIDENGVANEKLVKHYSDKGMKIKQVETSNIYDSAVDIVPCNYTYKETKRRIEEADYE